MMETEKRMMKCGCAENARDMEGNPVCCIHDCREVEEVKPDLTGRMARCCKVVPSKWNLPFFEYRGPGSDIGKRSCKHCSYYERAHTEEIRKRNKHVCSNFEPKGEFEFDSYYCGCHGWD